MPENTVGLRLEFMTFSNPIQLAKALGELKKVDLDTDRLQIMPRETYSLLGASALHELENKGQFQQTVVQRVIMPPRSLLVHHRAGDWDATAGRHADIRCTMTLTQLRAAWVANVTAWVQEMHRDKSYAAALTEMLSNSFRVVTVGNVTYIEVLMWGI
jgi:hypothetical protein